MERIEFTFNHDAKSVNEAMGISSERTDILSDGLSKILAEISTEEDPCKIGKSNIIEKAMKLGETAEEQIMCVAALVSQYDANSATDGCLRRCLEDGEKDKIKAIMDKFNAPISLEQ